MSDALKRAKAKYYQKIKDDPNYKEKMANNSKRYYEQNKEKQIEKTKKYYNENKDVISEKMKEKRNKNKLKDVLTKLDLKMKFSQFNFLLKFTYFYLYK